jgi:hypothetical protein
MLSPFGYMITVDLTARRSARIPHEPENAGQRFPIEALRNERLASGHLSRYQGMEVFMPKMLG